MKLFTMLLLMSCFSFIGDNVFANDERDKIHVVKITKDVVINEISNKTINRRPSLYITKNNTFKCGYYHHVGHRFIHETYDNIPSEKEWNLLKEITYNDVIREKRIPLDFGSFLLYPEIDEYGLINIMNNNIAKEQINNTLDLEKFVHLIKNNKKTK